MAAFPRARILSNFRMDRLGVLLQPAALPERQAASLDLAMVVPTAEVLGGGRGERVSGGRDAWNMDGLAHCRTAGYLPLFESAGTCWKCARSGTSIQALRS